MRQTFFNVLTAHAAAYPKMEACDYVKLAYQCEFGCGHLLTDREAAYRMLLEEWEHTPVDVLEPLTVDIGGGYARLNLAAAKRCMSAELVFAMFEKSVAPGGSREGFLRKVHNISRAASMGILPCSGDDVLSYAASLGDGMPSHSSCYRHLYGANYRVVSTEMATIAPICMLLSDAMKKAERINIAIDGCAASGKSTVARLLGELFDGTVISMDDYFLPVTKKTAERLAMPGGNVDYERLKAELTSERYADRLVHSRFDCQKQTLLPPKVEERRAVLLIEGVYSLHPDLRDFYDISILLQTDQESQRLRILERDGDALWHRYEAEWIPLEEAYFNATQPALFADFTVRT